MKYYLVTRIYDKPKRILVSTLEKAKEKLKQMFPSYLDDWCWWSNDILVRVEFPKELSKN